MRDADRRRLVEALAFALSAHGDQTRKGTQTPYASHLLSVAGLVLEVFDPLIERAQKRGLSLHDRLVGWEANWVLDDPSDEGAARFLGELAQMVREVIDEVE